MYCCCLCGYFSLRFFFLLFTIRYSVFGIFCVYFQMAKKNPWGEGAKQTARKKAREQTLKVDLKKKRTRKAKARGTGSAHSGNFLRNAGKKRCLVFGIRYSVSLPPYYSVCFFRNETEYLVSRWHEGSCDLLPNSANSCLEEETSWSEANLHLPVCRCKYKSEYRIPNTEPTS